MQGSAKITKLVSYQEVNECASTWVEEFFLDEEKQLLKKTKSKLQGGFLLLHS